MNWIQRIKTLSPIGCDYSMKSGDLVTFKNNRKTIFTKMEIIDINFAINAVAVRLFADDPKSGICVYPLKSLEKVKTP